MRSGSIVQVARLPTFPTHRTSECLKGIGLAGAADPATLSFGEKHKERLVLRPSRPGNWDPSRPMKSMV